MDIPVELSRIVITETTAEQVIVLKEKDGERSFPILIGMTEAVAIDWRLKGIRTPRPMTHELLANVIREFGGQLERICVSDLRVLDADDPRQTFIATIYVRRNGELLEIDSRPSDAIALGVAFGTPLFVAEHVFEAVLTGPGTRRERIALLRRRRDSLSEQIEEYNERLADEEFLRDVPQEVQDTWRGELEQMQQEYTALDEVLRNLG